jgi:hypothetical protein
MSLDCLFGVLGDLIHVQHQIRDRQKGWCAIQVHYGVGKGTQHHPLEWSHNMEKVLDV